jgi:hypothetical protein
MPILKDEKGMVLFRLIGKGMILAHTHCRFRLAVYLPLQTLHVKISASFAFGASDSMRISATTRILRNEPLFVELPAGPHRREKRSRASVATAQQPPRELYLKSRRVVTLIFIRFHSDLGDDADRRRYL